MLPVQSVPPEADQPNLSTEVYPQMLYMFAEIGSISKAIESVMFAAAWILKCPSTVKHSLQNVSITRALRIKLIFVFTSHFLYCNGSCNNLNQKLKIH
jgi:hypothetical protein